jgi:carbamoyltransferase
VEKDDEVAELKAVGDENAGPSPAPAEADPDLSEIAESLRPHLEILSRIEAWLTSDRRAIERQRDEALKTAEARLRVIEEQQAALDSYRRHSIRARMAPKLGVLSQYPPRALDIPDRYAATAPPPNPPAISIVTPSFQQGAFIARTIESVIGQRYPALQYIVQDGGSTDETLTVVERFRNALARFESSKDDGQAHALNRAFRHATGEILAYLNSDDLLLPGALNSVAGFFARHPEVDVVYGHRVVIDEQDFEIGRWILPRHRDGALIWADFIPQETLFWRRRIWERVGARLDESFRFALDWDLLLRFRDAGARFHRIPRFLGAFRVHHYQKTTAEIRRIGLQEMARLRERCHGRRVAEDEAWRRLRGYLIRHVVLHKLYRLGLLRY